MLANFPTNFFLSEKPERLESKENEHELEL